MTRGEKLLISTIAAGFFVEYLKVLLEGGEVVYLWISLCADPLHERNTILAVRQLFGKLQEPLPVLAQSVIWGVFAIGAIGYPMLNSCLQISKSNGENAGDCSAEHVRISMRFYAITVLVVFTLIPILYLLICEEPFSYTFMFLSLQNRPYILIFWIFTVSIAVWVASSWTGA